MLEHGGKLHQAAQQYNIPVTKWMDLSTGLNPNGWKISTIPHECWQRLPETNDGLIAAARLYYQCQNILAIAGTQAAIQLLPYCRPLSVVGVLNPAYAEHEHCWQKAGHEIIHLNSADIDAQISRLDVLIIINPNNPTGEQFSKQQLLKWHAQLARKDGWLILDEAFIDSQPQNSLRLLSGSKGLIILRSMGKFFGLAGIRCGFVFAETKLLHTLNEALGPWTISYPSRYIATQALLDTNWQFHTRINLPLRSKKLQELLIQHSIIPTGYCDLFVWIQTLEAPAIHQQLAQEGILTRLFTKPHGLRFGLPKTSEDYLRLSEVFKQHLLM